ncbi:hypothetical protein FRC11_013062 [Ceratobasidium sp. 423]|nr:hypothetical protein FRC11_013062 [Ceratobasidium sp. 423]
MTNQSCTVSTATTVSGQSRRQQPQQGAVGNPGPEDGNAQQVWQGEDVMPDGQGDQGDSDDEGPGGAAHQMNDQLVAWHGKSRDSVRQYIEVVFFSKDWSANMIKACIKELKAGGLHMKPGARWGTGYFQHNILQMCLEKIFFKTYQQKNKKDITMDFLGFMLLLMSMIWVFKTKTT